MTVNELICDAQHTLACYKRERREADEDVRRLEQSLRDAHRRQSRAFLGELACRDRIRELKET